MFVRWADVLVLVYSVTDRASFSLALQLLEQVRGVQIGICVIPFYREIPDFFLLLLPRPPPANFCA